MKTGRLVSHPMSVVRVSTSATSTSTRGRKSTQFHARRFRSSEASSVAPAEM
jgi:hypothetical protein